jgi:hypothetical protein
MLDESWTHKFYQRATRGALRVFLYLHEFPEDIDGLGHLPPEQRKKERMKLKKAKQRAKDKAAEEAAAAAEQDGEKDKEKEASRRRRAGRGRAAGEGLHGGGSGVDGAAE